MTAANAEQRKRWAADEGNHWVTEAERFDRMLSEHGDALIRAAAVEPAETVLDVGCGNGAVSLDLAARVGPRGSVTGVDLSPPMLATAKKRADERALGNVRFIEDDAQIADFGEEQFDLVTSRFGVMFFDDPVAAFSNLAKATKPDGRLVFACWQAVPNNEWLMTTAGVLLQFAPPPEAPPPGTPGPFALSDPEFTRGVLEKAGWVDVDFTDSEGSQWMGQTVDEVVDFLRPTEMAKGFMANADDETSAKAWAKVAETLEPHLTDEGIFLNGRIWLVSASR